MGDYRSLKVWERAHLLTLDVYRATRDFPSAELYGLTSQIRRAAASIPANLAEGSGRNSQPELARFAPIALGSADEVEYHLLLSRDLGYLNPNRFMELAEKTDHVKRMLSRFIDKLSASKAVTDSG